ncbi:hypothetical protein V8C43DRAFT_280146, partial [Trichoderma afarasin]
MQDDNASFQCSLIKRYGHHHQPIGTGVQTHSYSTVCMFVPDQNVDNQLVQSAHYLQTARYCRPVAPCLKNQGVKKQT